jgi:hypothetical protein
MGSEHDVQISGSRLRAASCFIRCFRFAFLCAGVFIGPNMFTLKMPGHVQGVNALAAKAIYPGVFH